MKVNFRQGLARYQKDANGNPIFLQRSNNGQYVNLVVSPTPALIVFAQRDATYLVEESKNVNNAWGPLSGTATKYLYWDVDMLNGSLTRGFTLMAPLYTSTAPNSPLVDQHWFDTIETVMRVWNGKAWIEKIRCFAGKITSNAIVTPLPLGSQAGITGDFEAGQILLDSFGTPLRQRNPNDPPHVNARFVTTTSWLNVVNSSNTQIRVEQQLILGMAAEEMGKFSLIQLRPGRRLVLARSTDYTSRVAGIVIDDLNESETGVVVNSGLVRNQGWSWPDAVINRALFCGPTGQVTVVAPQTGVVQQIGFIYDANSIWMEIKQPVVIDMPTEITPDPAPPPTGAPLANFNASPTTGTAPFTVNFTSVSPTADTFEWDFENNGYWDAVGPTTTHVYSTPGIYTVRHQASNIIGADVKIKSNFITVLNPNPGPLSTNLGVSIGGPVNATGGQPFGIQIIATNDGLQPAQGVTRSVSIRTDNGREVLVLDPGGAMVTRSGSGTPNAPYVTNLTFPPVDLASAGSAVVVFTVQVESSATNVSFNATVSSAQTDSDLDDNSTSFTVEVRP